MSSRRYLSEDFKIDIKATPKKVDIKADGDEAKEVEDLARSMFGDDFDFFSAFDDEEEATEEVDEPIDNGFEDEEEVEEEEVTDEDIEELTELFNASLDVDAHDFGGSGNNVSVLGGGIKEECEDKKDLEELFDAKVNLDAHNFGGNNNDVSVLSPGGMISEEANLDEGNIVKQYVHYKWADEKGTGPVDASADTVEGLAKKLGMSVGSVKSCISRGDPKFAKVEYDEDDEFDDIDLDAYEKRQAEKKNLEECGPIEEAETFKNKVRGVFKKDKSLSKDEFDKFMTTKVNPKFVLLPGGFKVSECDEFAKPEYCAAAVAKLKAAGYSVVAYRESGIDATIKDPKRPDLEFDITLGDVPYKDNAKFIVFGVSQDKNPAQYFYQPYVAADANTSLDDTINACIAAIKFCEENITLKEACENCEEELELREDSCPECEELENMSKEDLIALVKELRK